MVNKLTIILFSFISITASAQTEPCNTDDEQQMLEQCYVYSNLFGYDVDNIANPALFKTVNDWLGTTYCYAGNTKNGVDCSGFVSAIYKTVFHIDLEGSSKDIFKDAKTIKRSQLREGDLVFFRIRKKKVSHVGIYLGQNKFAHASVHDGVIISDLDEDYYKKYFYKGGRMKR